MIDRPVPEHGRYPFSPITTRTPFRWPGGRKLAVYFALGIEHYAFGEGMTENLVAGMSHPDVLNTSWREYGNRVAAWRLLQLFADFEIPLSIMLNSALCESMPSLVQACLDQGCELVAHGHSNSDTMVGMSEAEELHYLRGVSAQIQALAGRPPEGWSSPWLAETLSTPDLLPQAGYGYVLDWCMDDQPVWLRTRGAPLLAVPYTQEINDSAAIIGRQVGAEAFAHMITEQFDEMLETEDDQPLVMPIVVHSFISGQPFRLRALRRAIAHIAGFRDQIWLTQPGAIARHFRTLHPAEAAPGQP